MACLHEKELWDNRWCPVACFYCTGDQKKRCEHNKTTNADRIRAMNDEELASFFSETFCHGYGKPQLAEWIKSPAE